MTEEKFKQYVASLEVSKSLDGLTAEEFAEAKAIVDKAWQFYRDVYFNLQILKRDVRMCRECRKHKSCDECGAEECTRREDLEYYSKLADLGISSKESEEDDE